MNSKSLSPKQIKSRRGRKIRVAIARMYRKVINLGTSPYQELSENEKTAVRIFDKCLHKEDSELLIAPLSDTVYVKTGEIYIILQNNELRIINGKYSYDFNLPGVSCERMRRGFRLEVEKRRKKMEERIVAKTKRSLQDILLEVANISKVEENI